MKNESRILGLIILVLLPIFIEEICKHRGNIHYCQSLEPYYRDPEPVSDYKSAFFTFSSPYRIETIASSATTSTVATTTTL